MTMYASNAYEHVVTTSDNDDESPSNTGTIISSALMIIIGLAVICYCAFKRGPTGIGTKKCMKTGKASPFNKLKEQGTASTAELTSATAATSNQEGKSNAAEKSKDRTSSVIGAKTSSFSTGDTNSAISGGGGGKSAVTEASSASLSASFNVNQSSLVSAAKGSSGVKNEAGRTSQFGSQIGGSNSTGGDSSAGRSRAHSEAGGAGSKSETGKSNLAKEKVSSVIGSVPFIPGSSAVSGVTPSNAVVVTPSSSLSSSSIASKAGPSPLNASSGVKPSSAAGTPTSSSKSSVSSSLPLSFNTTASSGAPSSGITPGSSAVAGGKGAVVTKSNKPSDNA